MTIKLLDDFLLHDKLNYDTHFYGVDRSSVLIFKRSNQNFLQRFVLWITGDLISFVTHDISKEIAKPEFIDQISNSYYTANKIFQLLENIEVINKRAALFNSKKFFFCPKATLICTNKIRAVYDQILEDETKHRELVREGELNRKRAQSLILLARLNGERHTGTTYLDKELMIDSVLTVVFVSALTFIAWRLYHHYNSHMSYNTPQADTIHQANTILQPGNIQLLPDLATAIATDSNPSRVYLASLNFLKTAGNNTNEATDRLLTATNCIKYFNSGVFQYQGLRHCLEGKATWWIVARDDLIHYKNALKLLGISVSEFTSVASRIVALTAMQRFAHR